MKNRKILIMALLGFGIALVLGVALIVMRVQPSCWTLGDVPLVYNVTFNETSAESGNAGSRLTGKLQLRPSRAPAVFDWNKPLVLDGLFKPLSYINNGQVFEQFRDFNYNFQVEIDSQCHVQKLSFDGRETFSARRTLQRLMRVLALGREGQYSDFLGDSDMKLVESSDELKVFQRIAIKTAASSVKLEDSVLLDNIKKSEFRFEGKESALWFPKIQVAEELSIYSGAKHEKRNIQYTISMLQVKDEPMMPRAPIASPYRVEKKIGQDLRGNDRPSIYDNVNKTPPAAKDLKSAIEAFREQLSANGVEAKSQLIEFLKAHPEAIKDLQAMIEQNQFTDQELINVLFVLAKVGSDEAQDAMASLISNEGLDRGTRIRTIFAVGEIRLPSGGVIAAIRKEYQSLVSGGAVMDELSSTALLNGGLLAHNLRDVMPGEEDRILGDIEEVYKNAKSSEIKANAIDAMGNSSSLGFWDEISESAKSNSDLERRAAYEAMARVPSDAREQVLIDAMGSDRIAPARLAAIQTLKSVGVKDAQSLEKLKSALAREPDAINRAAAVQIVGQAIPFQPQAKEVLMEQIKKESDPGVLQAAGRFVSAYDIQKAKSAQKP
ncbi:MAG: HEAT repeat domain-containing protein [Proteobacteria bacterium]|nr:MAG: HEAT repeat domain-containing protein [Pseudomonadota bacterium]